MQIDTVIIGAGVVGLAIARAVARTGRELLVLEREAAVGTATSSRNSGVIHAGIYYKPGSLKARLCVSGKAMLYAYCASRGVGVKRCGKLIVATHGNEVEVLARYEANARRNGVSELERLTASAARDLEAEVVCVAALHSRTTGIIDVHELMQALEADIETNGGQVILNSEVDRAEPVRGGFVLRVNNDEQSELTCRHLVNAAGLAASAVAARIAALDSGFVPTTRFARGHYYALSGRPPFTRLVYPVADSAGLGTHVTVDLAGRVRFGPDVEWIDSVDYRFTRDRRAEFAHAIRRYYPGLDASRLVPDYAGIRPKLTAPGQPPADFRIDGPAVHGIAGLINLFGIESPGLTAALAIGEEVAGMLGP